LLTIVGQLDPLDESLTALEAQQELRPGKQSWFSQRLMPQAAQGA